MSQSWSSHHPLRAYRPEYITKETFQSCLESALDNYYKAGDRIRHYKRVRFLAVTWLVDRESGLRIGSRSECLAGIFERSYKYEVHRCILTGQNPGQLDEAVEELVHDSTKDDLVIIHYIGHGFNRRPAPEEEYELMLAQDGFENPVNLTRIRRKYIDNAPADVLILLDCCHSGVASIGSNKEIIAAAASESMAYNDSVINQSESFTTGLIQQLQHAAATKQVMTSPQLYSQLATRALQHESRGRRTVPLHLHNYQQNRAPIYFAPLFKKEEWVATPNSMIYRQPVTVVLHAHLQDGTREAIEELTEWTTRSRPPCANRIRIMDVIPSNSVTVIFEVTLDVWDSLPANASIWFVDFQRYTVATESSVVPGPSAVFPSPGLHEPVAPCVTQVPSVQPLGFAKYASGSKVSPFGQIKENVPPGEKAPWQQSPSKLKKDED